VKSQPPLQHVLDRAFGLCELLCIAGASTTFVLLRIEERRAADCDRRIGLADLAGLHTNVALARIHAHCV
jgi:hypothetical protein